MNQRDAKDYGIENGHAAIRFCEASESDQREAHCECLQTGTDACEDCLTTAAFDSEQNARQFTPFEFFAHDINECGDRADGLWEAYDQGVGVGIRKGLKARLAQLLAE